MFSSTVLSKYTTSSKQGQPQFQKKIQRKISVGIPGVFLDNGMEREGLSMLAIGTAAPQFKLPDQNGVMHSLKDYRGKKVILYFYPKDNTSGCTQEACNFRDNMNRLAPYSFVIGVSPDSIKSHQKFKEKENLNFILLSDPEHILANQFNVWVQKSMYGRKYMGIERSTFIFDENLNLIKEWRKVKVNGHVDEILSFLLKD